MTKMHIRRHTFSQYPGLPLWCVFRTRTSHSPLFASASMYRVMLYAARRYERQQRAIKRL